jgi:hypothetical protein
VSASARRARLSRPDLSVPTAALVGGVPAEAVRRSGWEVRARLAADPLSGPDDAAGYADAVDLLDDAAVDLAVVDGEQPAFAALVPRLRRAGLLVVLAGPAPLEVEPVRAARAVDGPPALVALATRWEPWARTVRAAVPLAGLPLQVTVRGWPRGPAAAAELVDAVRLWCGEVAAVVASPAALPAAALPDGEPVSWALLTETGASVLVAHGGPTRRVRVSFATARLDATPEGVRWEGGERLPLAPPPPWQPPAPAGAPAGLVATVAWIADAVGGREPRPHGPGDGVEPLPADLGDLLAAARAVEALRESARSAAPVRVA